MGVTVSLPLFGTPGHELEEKVRSKDLRDLAEALRERLLQAADLLDRLNADGWRAEPGAFDLVLTHPRIDTEEEARRRLQQIGIDPAQLMIVEDVEEDDALGD